MARRNDLSKAHLPPTYTKEEVYALRNIAQGNATPEQQKEFMEWLLQHVCRTYDLSYRPESDRETVFAEGRRFVGLELVGLLRTPANKLNYIEDRQPHEKTKPT